ncbi:MAG: HD domain-containing protein, partial [Gammaproteobacteria bacterium]|nr:HD domain-containing protein [Gammaproteobacteria bacterium]
MVSTEQAELSADHNSAVNSSDLVMQAMMLLQEAHPNRIGQAEELVGIMSSLGVDEQTIAAGVLFEGFGTNNGSRLDLVSERSDAAVFRLVQEVVRIENKRLDWIAVASEEDKSKNELAVSMMLMSMMKDPRVVFIMLAHQLRVIRHAKRSGEEIKKRVALETQQVFVPLANRLGIGQVKWELEDLSFRYLHPQQYKDIAKALEERRVVRESYMQSVVKKIGSLLQEEGLRAQVYGRPKHIFSIWKKMQNKHLDFSELYDVRAVRIVVSDVAACYEALSIVHNAWQLIPEEYDDYIAAPKQNGYQSLHTAVVGPENKTLEVQIRTHSMHQQAELGVAAHWRYKEGGKSVLESQSTINAIRDALSKENELSPASEAITSSKIYVLSPKGRVIELPKGATPLDFAYRIHTDVGHRCRGAKVNGKMVPLTTELSSGQQVEVMTGKEPQPSRDWLSPKSGYLKSTQALNKVRHWFKQQFREEHTNEGKAALLRELGEKRLSSDLLSFLSQKFNYTVEDDFFAAIGRGDLGIQQVVNAIPVEEEQTEQTEIATTSKGIAHQR